MGIFAPDSKLMTSLSRYVDAFFLNLLAFLVSIPIVTIGASTTAKYYVALKLSRGESVKIIPSFFHSFRANFKQATQIWIPSLFFFVVLAFDFFYSRSFLSGWSLRGLQSLSLLLGIFLFQMLLMAFPILARFEVSNKDLLKDALAMVALHFPTAFLALVLYLIPAILLFYFTQFAIIGILTPALLTIFVADRCNFFFQALLPEESETPEEETISEQSQELIRMREESEMHWPPVAGLGKVYRESKQSQSRERDEVKPSFADSKYNQGGADRGTREDAKELVRATAEDEEALRRALESPEAKRIQEKERLWVDPHDL